jgi:UDP-N-acetylmuramate dehydrogenase
MKQQPAVQIQQNVSLKRFNTFHVEAYAAYFAVLKRKEELLTLSQDAKFRTLPKFVLGGGSNILLTKNFNGLVIKLDNHGIRTLKETDEYIWLEVKAAEHWNAFVRYCIEHNYAGVENLVLIPGTVGAAVVQNAGAYGMETANTLESVETIHIKTGHIKTFSAKECLFEYRSSFFKTKDNSFIVTQAVFKLFKRPHFNVEYAPLRQALKGKSLTLQTIAQAIINIRKEKLPDYRKFGNAGSFFKNPIVSFDEFDKLLKKYPNIPHWKHDHHVKLAAAWLIEQCGWKGRRIGDVGVYEKHALVLLNYGNATGEAIQKFANDIIQSVFEKFNVRLEPEVIIL